MTLTRGGILIAYPDSHISHFTGLEPGQKSCNCPLLFCIDKSYLGVSPTEVATPWDDCPSTKSNANTFVRACAYRVFLTSCVGINLGDIPLVDPSTLGRKTLYELAYLKYCHNARVQHRSVKAVTCRLLIDFRH